MIDFFAAAEHTLMKRATLDVSLEVLRARRDKFIKDAGPAGYPTASFRDGVGYSGSGSTNDAITEMIGLDVMKDADNTFNSKATKAKTLW